jgi:hypothetical protein
MEENDSPPLPPVTWAVILVSFLCGLAFLYSYIVPNCANLPIRGRVYGDCGTSMLVVYVCAVMFLGAVAFSLCQLALAAAKRLKK